MNNLSKSTLRFAGAALRSGFACKRDFTRNLWHMSKSPESSQNFNILKVQQPSLGCACGCGGAKHVHTKGKQMIIWTFLFKIDLGGNFHTYIT